MLLSIQNGRLNSQFRKRKILQLDRNRAALLLASSRHQEWATYLFRCTARTCGCPVPMTPCETDAGSLGHNFAFKSVTATLLPCNFAALIRVRLGCWRTTRANASPTTSAKPGGVWAGSQLLIAKGEQSGLLTRIAMTESVSSCERMKS